MSADIKLDGDNLILEGNVIINDHEVQSTGPNSGYAFRDRTFPNTHRFVLYAGDGEVRLWSDSAGRDILSINQFGIETVNPWAGPIIKVPGENSVPPEPRENRSLNGVIKILFDQIKALKDQIKELKEKGN